MNDIPCVDTLFGKRKGIWPAETSSPILETKEESIGRKSPKSGGTVTLSPSKPEPIDILISYSCCVSLFLMFELYCCINRQLELSCIWRNISNLFCPNHSFLGFPRVWKVWKNEKSGCQSPEIGYWSWRSRDFGQHGPEKLIWPAH